jgi:hypothetical protein
MDFVINVKLYLKYEAIQTSIQRRFASLRCCLRLIIIKYIQCVTFTIAEFFSTTEFAFDWLRYVASKRIMSIGIIQDVIN